MRSFGKPRIIEDINCVEVSIKVRGIADTNRPNSKRPLYRTVKKITPIILYNKATDEYIMHPVKAAELRARLESSTY